MSAKEFETSDSDRPVRPPAQSERRLDRVHGRRGLPVSQAAGRTAAGTPTPGIYRHTWHGRAIAILRPAKTPGHLTLTASAEGLRPATVTLPVRPS
ncbi:hypothetical protein [Streptomyces geranii]|uniref:hypothetical protein n=1 Tax=Streptomyces geranii TaxID=2058923 RepID=UPI000D02A231